MFLGSIRIMMDTVQSIEERALQQQKELQKKRESQSSRKGIPIYIFSLTIYLDKSHNSDEESTEEMEVIDDTSKKQVLSDEQVLQSIQSKNKKTLGRAKGNLHQY